MTWLGHATVVLDLAGCRIVTDPLLGRHNGPLRRRGPRPRRSDWQGADAVLLSHLHHDHAEVSSLRALAPAPVFTARANVAWLQRKSLPGVALEDPGAHGPRWSEVAPGVEVAQVRAEHAGRPMPHRPNAANGHLIRSGTRSIYVVGDSDLVDEMALVPQWLAGRPDLVVVPIAGWGPRLSEGHLDPVRAAEACARVGARWALPYHSGTLHPPLMRGAWLDRPLRAFADALQHRAPETERAPIAGVAGVHWAVP